MGARQGVGGLYALRGTRVVGGKRESGGREIRDSMDVQWRNGGEIGGNGSS